MKADYSLFERSGVYKIYNKINGKSYIGSSCNLYNRLYEHIRYLRLNKHANPKLQSAFNKYGEENFEWKIITFGNCDYCLKIEQLCFDTYRPEYNIYLKAESCNRTLSEETKSKIGEKSKQKFIDNPELLKIMSENGKKLGGWNKGKTGIYSNETLSKMSIAGKNSYSSKLGRPEVMENRKKAVIEKNRVPVSIYDKDWNLINSFSSITEAAKQLNLPKFAVQAIHPAIDTNRFRYGFHWKRDKK